MTESTQLQTTENNNTGVVKMEPPPPTSSNSAVASTAASTAATSSPSPSATMEQQQQQQQQQYALKWNDFQSSILNSFRHLRDEEDFVDVTLACDARSYSAHKVVLSACSPYFRKLLKANPCEHPIVILKDVCADDVENLLSFMYNGEVNVSHEHLSDFLKTAHLLQIRGLADVNGGVYGDALNTNNPKALSESLSNNNLSINLSNKMNFLNKNAQNNSSNNHSGSNIFAPPSLPSATSLTPTNNSLVNSNNSNLNSGHQSNHTPAIQELKASSASPVRKSNNKSNHHWDLNDMENNRHQHLTPPPQKRIKSADLFRAQHGISPERLLIEREFPVAGQHALTRERHRDRDRSRETSRDRERDRERNLEFRESLLGQALENNNGSQHSTQKQHADLASLHAQSAGEDSNSSDTEPSDRGDAQHDGTMDSINGSLDNPRSHSFPSAFLGLQGIPGLLPGPSGIGANDFAVDVQQKFRKLLSAPIKEEIIESLEPDTAQSLVLRRESSQSPSREKLAHTHSPSHSKRHHVKIKRSRSVTSSPTPTSWATTGENNDNNNGFALPPDDDDERSSSACSAISLTMKTSVRHKCENTFYQQLLIKQEQQQQQQQHQQQQQQHEHQQQQYLDDLKQTATVSHHHQQQLTANFFMARNFPELFQNSSAAAVAAAAAAAATASTAAAAAAAAAVANSNNNNNNNNNTTNSNYMLPCPLCETPLEQRLFRQHLDHHYPRDSPVCPVIECGRRFAHPNSVRNHMRIKHTLQWAKMKAMRSSGGPFASTGDFKEKFW